MTSSTFIVTDRLRPLLSVGYANSGSRIDAETPAREHLGRGYKVPNGGIYSTVGDLAKFIGALTGAGKTVTSEAMRRAMMTKQTPEAGESGYGFGLQLSASAGAITVVGHGGSVAGYTAHVAFDPASNVGVILLRNYGSGRTNLGQSATQLVRALAAERRAPAGPVVVK
jgi:CubicO group peptidase (beta-lactamase class C family)